jgi:hypothetical protein
MGRWRDQLFDSSSCSGRVGFASMRRWCSMTVIFDRYRGSLLVRRGRAAGAARWATDRGAATLGALPPIYVQDGFAVKVESLRQARPPAYALGLSRTQVEDRVLAPWIYGRSLRLDGQPFEPGSFRVEIRPCAVIVDPSDMPASYAALDTPVVTDVFLETYEGQRAASGDDSADNEGPERTHGAAGSPVPSLTRSGHPAGDDVASAPVAARRKAGQLLAGAGKWVGGALIAPIIVGALVWRVTTSHGPTQTAVSILRPFDGDRLNSRLKVTKIVHGTCGNFPQGAAQGSGNPEAVRCFGSDNFVYDPCYPSQTGRRAACPKRPWSEKVTVLSLSSPVRVGFRNSFPGRHDHVYGMELKGGDRCFFLEGAGQVTVAGVRVNYRCERGDVVGSPNRLSPLWQATYVAHGDAETRVIEVVRVWF